MTFVPADDLVSLCYDYFFYMDIIDNTKKQNNPDKGLFCVEDGITFRRRSHHRTHHFVGDPLLDELRLQRERDRRSPCH